MTVAQGGPIRRYAASTPPPPPTPDGTTLPCSGTDLALWFPAPRDVATIDQAKALCAGCPARVACLEQAMADPGLIGVWGGTTELDRWPDRVRHGGEIGIAAHRQRHEQPCGKCRRWLDREAARRAEAKQAAS